jgi:hypothetical protein
VERTKTFVNGGRVYPADINAIEDRAAEMLEGTAAAIPSSHYAGRFYRATDTGQLWLDNGTSWILQNSSAKSIIATEQERTNTSLGLLTTPDEVTIVLPENGLIAVAYQALWEQSVSGAGRALLFLGENAVKITNGTGPATPSSATFTGASGEFTPLATSPLGLVSINASSGKAYETTGTFVGIEGKTGGPCYIFAAAGSYKVSVRFSSTSGSIKAKERKLWAWAVM